MRSVVVTGAAGALGQRVVAALAERDDVAAVTAIDVEAAPAGLATRVTYHRIDLSVPADPDPLAALLGGADTVIHLAWVTGDARGAAPPGEDSLLVLRRVLAATGPAAALVHLSSATVYGAWSDNPVPLTEDVPLRPNPEFGFAVGKAEAERVVAEWSAQRSGAPVCVLRPCVVVGVPERPLYQALAGTRSLRAGDSGRLVQFLHVDDLVSAVLLAWDRRLDGVYNVAPDAGTREDTARALAGGVARIPVPGRVGVAVGHLGWHLWRSGAPAEARAYSRHSWTVAPDRLIAAGWHPRYSSEEALVATDDRSHWDDLPPGRRQEFTLLVAVGGVVGLGAAVAGVWVGLRRRTRSRA